MAIQDLRASLDLKQNLNIYVQCKQFDSLNLILNIFDNSVQANLANYNVRLVAMKADKVPLIQEQMGITINNNVVTIAASEQLTTTSGNTLVELQFIHKTTGQRKAMFNLVLMVNPSALEMGSTISTATYTLLQELENKLDQAGSFLENIDEAIEANDNLTATLATATTKNADLEANNSTAATLIANGTTLNNSLSANITEGTTLDSNLDAANTLATSNITAMESFGDVTQLAQNVNAVKTEVETARNGEVSLDARLDKNDALVTSHTTSLSDVAHKNGTLQSNLNADLLDGQHGSYYAPLASPNFTGIPQIVGKNIATCETTILTLLNGWTNSGGVQSRVSRNGNQVTLNMCVSGGSLSNNVNICVLPSQYRPTSSTYLVWAKTENSSYVASDCLLYIGVDGSLQSTGVLSGNTRLIITTSFTI